MHRLPLWTATLPVAAPLLFVLSLGLLSTPVRAQRDGTEMLRQLEELGASREFACLMHSDERGVDGGVCGKCGMPLAPLDPEIEGTFGLEIATVPSDPEPGESFELVFTVQHPDTRQAVRELLEVHERPFHLFVVRKDLEVYRHEHPQRDDDGNWSLRMTLPAGEYVTHADFFPSGGTPQVLRRSLKVGEPAAAEAELVVDDSFVRETETVTATLETEDLRAGESLVLRFRLSDPESGEPVRDLEPYLGAWGHTLILNADQSLYLHSHPVEDLQVEGEVGGGPLVGFRVFFPEPGFYRLWSQFQRQGQVETMSFTVAVAEGVSPTG